LQLFLFDECWEIRKGGILIGIMKTSVSDGIGGNVGRDGGAWGGKCSG